MDEKTRRRAIYQADQKRTLQKFKEAWENGSPTLTKKIQDNMSKSPSYKKYRKTKVIGQAGIAGGAAGLGTGIASSGTPKQRIIRGLIGASAGALAGGGIGQLQASKSLRTKSKKMAVGTTKVLMNRELVKNMKLHRFLAKPGIQNVKVNRPWGVEKYSG